MDFSVLETLSMMTFGPYGRPSISMSEAKGSGSNRLRKEWSMTTVSVASRRAAASASLTALLTEGGSGEITGTGMRGGVLSMMCRWPCWPSTVSVDVIPLPAQKEIITF